MVLALRIQFLCVCYEDIAAVCASDIKAFIAFYVFEL